MRGRILTIFLLAAVAVGPIYASENPVVNGTFDTDLVGWSTGNGFQAWFPEDATGGASGSAMLTSDHPSAGTVRTPLSQCVVVDPGRYLLRGAMRIPSGQSTTGEAYLIAYAYGNAGCGGVPVAGAFWTSEVVSNLWTSEGVEVEVPLDGASVSIRTQVLKYDAGGVFDALFDDVELIPYEIFQDGFESGDATNWSLSMP